MRILVIGGNGFVGMPLVRELIQAGHDIAILHRGTGDLPSSALQIQGDRNRLRNVDPEIRAFAPDVIMDMILSSAKQDEDLTAMSKHFNARVVAISSMDVYRAWGVLLGTEPGGLEPMPITEDSALRMGSRTYSPDVVKTLKGVFSWLTEDYDKVAVEETVMRGGTGNTVVRLPMVYGPGDPLHRMHGFLKRIADWRPAVILPDDYAAWRGPRGYVENVAHAIALACVSDKARGRIYHVCEEPSLSELEWEQKIAAQVGWPGKFVIMPREKAPKHLLQPGDARQQIVANSDRIRVELSYEEPFSTELAIRRTVVWERANPPTGTSFHHFDYEAEDLALASVATSS